MKHTFSLIVVAVLFSFLDLSAQKKVLGLPEAFERPEDARYEILSNETSNQSEKREWWVMSDRSDNPVYAKPNFSSKEVARMDFKEYFLVVDNREGWVEIAKYQTVEYLKPRDKLEVVGWVNKEYLLLWPAALRDPGTKIERKAFLLNNRDQIFEILKNEDTDFSKINFKNIYDRPGNGKKLADTQIYQFYFVYKKVKTARDNWYLLGSDSRFHFPSRAEKGIIGWVNLEDLATWDTNLCLEPNYEEEAYNERSRNKNLRIRTFNNQDALRDVSVDNPGDMSEVYMDANDGSDVVGFGSSDKAKSNPRRHKGKVMRYPYLDQGLIFKTPYYITGQIGSLPVGTDKDGFDQAMSEMTLSELNGALVQMQRSLEEFNLFFVIDGTKEMGRYKESLLSAIRSLESNRSLTEPGRSVRYGAMVYRKLGNGSKEFEPIEPTVDLESFVSSLEAIEFSNAFGSDVSFGSGTLLKQGIKKGVRAANFNENAMNALIILGNEGDVSFNRANNVPDEYLVSDSDLREINDDLAKLGVSVHSIQFANTESKADKNYRGFTFIDIILASAKTQVNLKRKVEATNELVEKVELTEPNPIKKQAYNRLKLSSYKTGTTYYKEDAGVLPSDSIAKYLNNSINTYADERLVEVEIIDGLVRKLDALDMGALSEQFGLSSGTINDRAYQSLTEFAEKSGVSVESMLQATEQKLDLFQRVFIPVQPEGAKYPSCKFVIFMTEEHLVDYKNTLGSGLNACRENNAGTYQKREAVQNMLESMLEVFTGDTKLDEEFKEMNPDEYATKVKGIEDILAAETPLIKNLNDIQNSRKVDNDELEKYIQRCQKIYDGLDEITKTREENQDFVLKTVNNEYFWLTLDQIY